MLEGRSLGPGVVGVIPSWKGRGLQETSAPDSEVTARWGFLDKLEFKIDSALPAGWFGAHHYIFWSIRAVSLIIKCE